MIIFSMFSNSPWKQWALPTALSAALALFAPFAAAERQDRLQKIDIKADQNGRLDLKKQVSVFKGNVVVSQGSLVIKADRLEVSESADGYTFATAYGVPGAPASFRQKREGSNEFIEGEAERLEYDTKTDMVRFVNKASVRRVRDSKVIDEVVGALITYDNTAELFTVEGGRAAPTSANSNPPASGRVQVTLTPREGTPAAAEAASAARGKR